MASDAVTNSEAVTDGLDARSMWGIVENRSRIVTCCGCGMPVDQTNPRCKILDPDAYMGTYGPCCASMTLKERRRWEKRRTRVASGKKLRRSALR